MSHEKMVVKLFDYFYNKIYKTNFRLDLSIANQQKQLDSFIKMLSVYYPSLDGIGINHLISYMSFAFFSYSDKNLKRKISLNWIIGKKTFAKWFDQAEGHKYYVDQWLKENNILIDQLRQDLVEEQLMEQKLDPAEEIEKIRFAGDARLYNCIQNTTLYNHRSINCIGCEEKFTCKILLNSKYPKLFKSRGYK